MAEGVLSVWATLRRRDKVVADRNYKCNMDAILSDVLDDACKAFDVSKPVLLNKHESDLMKFNRVVFRKADFMDTFGYDSLELEVVRDRKKDNILYM